MTTTPNLAVEFDPAFGDDDGDGDALAEFVALLMMRVSERGELISKVVEQDVVYALADMAGPTTGVRHDA